jgi:hypothetical protein
MKLIDHILQIQNRFLRAHIAHTGYCFLNLFQILSDDYIHYRRKSKHEASN